MSDSRTKLEHDIQIGQVYTDARTDDRAKVVYLDDDVALLRDPDSYNRLEKRKQFDKDVGSGRYSLTDTDGEERFGYAGRMSAVRELLSEYSEQSGRSSSHKADAIREVLSLLTEETDDFKEVDFESIDGIGSATADSLCDAGYTTVQDIDRASDSELLDVSGVGQANLQNLRDHL